MLDTVVMSGDDVCCSVVFGTLVGVFTSPARTECGMFVMYCVVCPCQLFCSAWMWCLEEVYRCLLL